MLKKVKEKQAKIAVIGLGRVGLPIAAIFAVKGMKTIGIDVNDERLNAIKNSVCPFYDPELQKTLTEAMESGNFFISNNLKSDSSTTDVIFVTVGTPNTVDNRIDYTQLYSALNEIASIDLKEKMIILRSTLPPKTTVEIIQPYLEDKTSLRCGEDFGLAVCPERILEGRAVKEIFELPEIIGGVNNLSSEIATEIFKIINPKKEFLITSPSTAEMAKLFSNIYRYIGFALANEFAIWAERYGLDGAEIIKIANYNYPRSNIPIPGFAGGPCLSKDGLFLDKNTTFSSIVSTAWKLNESVPQHIVNKIKNETGNLFNKKISVLGLSFKKGSDDLRNSPSVTLVEILKSTGAKVSVHDPHIKGTDSLSKVLKSPDIIIIATNHKEFENIQQELRNSKCKFIYDVWNMYKDEDFKNITYRRFGHGFESKTIL